jgi:WD40 repeat protein
VGSFDGNAYVWRFRGIGIEQSISRNPITGQRIVTDASSSSVMYTRDTIQSVLVATLEGHENEVKGISWSPSGSLIATCSRDKSIWLWEVIEDGEDFDCMAVLHGHEQDVKFIQWHPTREILFSASYDNTLKCWGETNDDWICINTLSGHNSTVWGFALNSEGDTLLSVSDDKSIRIWHGEPLVTGVSLVIDGMNWTFMQEINDAHERTIYSIDFSRKIGLKDNDCTENSKEEITNIYNLPRIVTGGGDDILKIWRLESNNDSNPKISLVPVVIIPHAHFNEINCVRWNPHDTTLLASASDDMTIKLWRYEEYRG